MRGGASCIARRAPCFPRMDAATVAPPNEDEMMPKSAQTIVDFRSDNTGRASPELIEALAKANQGTAAG